MGKRGTPSFSFFEKTKKEGHPELQTMYMGFARSRRRQILNFFCFLDNILNTGRAILQLKAVYKAWVWCTRSILRCSPVSCFLNIIGLKISMLVFFFTVIWRKYIFYKQITMSKATKCLVITRTIFFKHEVSICCKKMESYVQGSSFYKYFSVWPSELPEVHREEHVETSIKLPYKVSHIQTNQRLLLLPSRYNSTPMCSPKKLLPTILSASRSQASNIFSNVSVILSAERSSELYDFGNVSLLCVGAVMKSIRHAPRSVHIPMPL